MAESRRITYYLGLADKLESEQNLSDEELSSVLLCDDSDFDRYLTEKARAVRERIYSKDVYLRGLIEFTNYCKNNCYYCGIRAENKNAERYRLSEEEIISCSDKGYELGFRTFVLQGGEDPFYTDERIVSIIRKIYLLFVCFCRRYCFRLQLRLGQLILWVGKRVFQPEQML